MPLRDFKPRRHTRSLSRRVLREIARPFEKATRLVAPIALKRSKRDHRRISEKVRFVYQLLQAERSKLIISAID
jgi:hypothetical protein